LTDEYPPPPSPPPQLIIEIFQYIRLFDNNFRGIVPPNLDNKTL
jgi:hypothetical protein